MRGRPHIFVDGKDGDNVLIPSDSWSTYDEEE